MQAFINSVFVAVAWTVGIILLILEIGEVVK